MAAWHDPAWASFEPGNSHVKSLYETLPMPTNGRWSEPRRQKWDVEGKPSDPAHGFLCSSKLTLRQLVSRTHLSRALSLGAEPTLRDVLARPEMAKRSPRPGARA